MNELVKNILSEEILNEVVKFEAGCLMIDLSNKIKNWNEIIKFIDPIDIYDNKDKEYGITSPDDIHCTILFGFNKIVSHKDVQNLLENVNQNVRLKIIGISIFESDSDPYDVVKFDVESEDLNRLHELSKELPHKLTFLEYHPHITISYVKKGEGKKYIKNLSKPIELEANKFLFSSTDKKVHDWKIKKQYKHSIPLNESHQLVDDLVFYHGTKNNFDKFNLSQFGLSDGGWLGRGIYLTNDINYAESYGNVLKCKIDIKYPYILTDYTYSRSPNKLMNNLGVPNSTGVTKKLIEMGYDSVLLIYDNSEFGGLDDFMEICVFDPSKIQIIK